MQFLKRNAEDIHIVARAAGPDVDTLRQEVEKGVSELFTLGDLHILTRSEITTRGRELVIVCTEGTNIVRPIRYLVNTIARLGYEFIRFHPTTKGRGKATIRIAATGYPVKWIEEPGAAYYVADLRGHDGQ